MGNMKAVIAFCVISLSAALGHAQADKEWWRTMSLYQIYPRSFKDSNGDGVGDIKGISSKLDHLAESNIDAFWLSPIYPSPMVDFGYDISDFVGIDPIFGTLKDFEDMVKIAHDKSLKVIMDFVPNHSSDKHEWFKKSLKKIDPYTDYYVWHKGRISKDGTVSPPNNWVSVFGGSAWTWREERQAYYFHQFAVEQPDLNYNNEHVIEEMKNVLRFWLRKGVDGFRVDAIPHLCEDPKFEDEPLTGDTADPDNYGYTDKVYTKDQPRTYEIVTGWRGVVDEVKTTGDAEKILMMEAYANLSSTMKYYDAGAHFPFNFALITDVNENSGATDFKRLIDRWMSNMPSSGVANWVAGNHDKTRLVTRFGTERSKAVTMMTLLLPGVGVTYNGEEIGMNDTYISWEETKDPQACNGFGESRDPERTPFQWDGSTSAGFSTNRKTWLPVNENYETVNLAAEKRDPKSYYTLYKAVSKLRKTRPVKTGGLTTKVLNENVLVFARETDDAGSVYAIINFKSKEEIVDLSVFDKAPAQLRRYCSTEKCDSIDGPATNSKSVKIPPQGAAVYVDPKIAL